MTQDIWTISRLKTYQACPMKEHYRYSKCLAPIARKAALRIGSAVHRGIEMWDIQKGLDVLNDNLCAPETQEEADDREIAIATVQAMLAGYMEFTEPFKNHCPEQKFELAVMMPGGRKSRKLRFAGKIDDIARIDGQDWIVEYKTASQLSSGYFERLYLDTQITGYTYAARRMGYKPVGVIYRVLRKPSIRKGQKESLEQFLNRLEADYKARPEFYFMEERLYRSQTDLDEFERQLYESIQQAQRMREKGCIFKHTGSCSDYGTCAYMPLCCGEKDAEYLFEIRQPHEELGRSEE